MDLAAYQYYRQSTNDTFADPIIPRDVTQPTVKTSYNLFIDSRDRSPTFNASNVPDASNSSPFNYSIYVNSSAQGYQDASGTAIAKSIGAETFRNVVSVELKASSFPKVNFENYVVLDCDEINNLVINTDDGCDRMFAVLYFDSDSLTPGQVKPMRGGDFGSKIKTFDPPLSSLSRFTIKFRRYGGDLVVVDDVGGMANIDHTLLFEIVCKN